MINITIVRILLFQIFCKNFLRFYIFENSISYDKAPSKVSLDCRQKAESDELNLKIFEFKQSLMATFYYHFFNKGFCGNSGDLGKVSLDCRHITCRNQWTFQKNLIENEKVTNSHKVLKLFGNSIGQGKANAIASQDFRQIAKTVPDGLMYQRGVKLANLEFFENSTYHGKATFGVSLEFRQLAKLRKLNLQNVNLLDSEKACLSKGKF